MKKLFKGHITFFIVCVMLIALFSAGSMQAQAATKNSDVVVTEVPDEEEEDEVTETLAPEQTEEPEESTPETTAEPEETQEPEATHTPTPTVKPQATETPSATVKPEVDEDKYDSYFKNVSVTTGVTRAVGKTYQFSVKSLKLSSSKYTVKWTSSNKSIATVGASSGLVTAKATGTAKITATITCDNKAVYTYTGKIKVTNPKFTQSNYFVKTGSKVKVSVTGTSTTSYTLKTSASKKVSLVSGSNKKVKGVAAGKAKITTTVDGKTISCYVYVSKPSLNHTDLFIVKGKSVQLSVKNWSKKSTVTYKSSNTKVATVSKSGKITTKKNGSCKITVTVDNQTLTCYVAVGNKTVISTLKRAYKAIGCPYSQPKRMRTGYYDCSSLVWRSYSKSGVYFGSTTYAPTAAAQARYLVTKKKALYYTTVSSSKLIPGDVIYVRSSTYNGRYKNIGHVAFYIGNGRILHATPPRVCISEYTRYSGRIAVIARPTK